MAYDYQWQQLSAKKLKASPYCEVVGCRRRARHVDHIVTVKAAPHLRLEWSNLQSLCIHHHSIVTKAFDSGSIRGACDTEGMPVDPTHPWNQADSKAAIDTVNTGPTVNPYVAGALKRDYVRKRRGN